MKDIYEMRDWASECGREQGDSPVTCYGWGPIRYFKSNGREYPELVRDWNAPKAPSPLHNWGSFVANYGAEQCKKLNPDYQPEGKEKCPEGTWDTNILLQVRRKLSRNFTRKVTRQKPNLFLHRNLIYYLFFSRSP